MRTYCTYFDRNDLVKALALIDSLNRHETQPFRLVAVCLDELTEKLLKQIAPPNLVTLPISSIEAGDTELLAARSKRTLVQYYRTLPPTVILRLLQNIPGTDSITYLNADLFFYSSPEPIFQEFANSSVLIHSHNFSPTQEYSETYGKYSVGLLCFRNDEHGIKTLEWWRDRCNEWCYDRIEDGKYIDQLYLNDWPTCFQRVAVLQHPGAGVAPWNHDKFEYSTDAAGGVTVDGRSLIFYHFHALAFISPEIIIPAKHLNYPMTLDVLQLAVLPYLKVLQSNISLIRKLSPDFNFGITSDSSTLSQSHTFVAKKSLATALHEAGANHPVFSLDDTWDYYLSGQMLPPERKAFQCRQLPDTGKITVATSIAPFDIQKQQNAVESWLKLGFYVISINTATETDFLKSLFPDVYFVTTNRTSEPLIGKPLIFLDDVLAALESCGGRICGIINSDIIMQANQEIIEFFSNLREDVFVCDARVDFDSMEMLSEPKYLYGRDYFFFNKSVIKNIPSSYFCLGAPWWDLWLPLAALQAGYRLLNPKENIAFHPKHKLNWSFYIYHLMSSFFAASLRYYCHPIIFQPDYFKNLKALLDDGQDREHLEGVTEYLVANTEFVSLSQPILDVVTCDINCLLVTIPKQFIGHIGIIQENALLSWLRLLPSSSIILFGDDPTVAEMAARYGVKHISDIKCNRNGTPYLSDLFEQSCRQLGNEQFFAYVNADCILDGNFLKALQALSLNGYIKNKFIASAQRCNIPVIELIDFSSANISETLKCFYANGVLDAKNAMDIFICHPDVLKAFPNFLVGRPGWDQWLVWHAHESGADVIDASEAFTVYHQSHDYTHVPGGWREACLGEEAIYNRRLAAGKIMDLFTARTHQLLEDGTVTTDLYGENSQHTDERAFYYAQQAIACMESEEYLGALDYIDMLLVAGKDAVPFAQQLRAVCFYKLGRMLEAKSAIINELLVNPANKEAQAIFSMISKEISAGS